MVFILAYDWPKVTISRRILDYGGHGNRHLTLAKVIALADIIVRLDACEEAELV